MTGNRCVCALKKDDHSGSEDGSRPPSRSLAHQHGVHKPTISSRKSESSIPRIRNGHHPPMHRLNNAAHEVGLPYQVRRLNSVGVPTNLAVQPLDPSPITSNATSKSTQAPLPAASKEVVSQDERVWESAHGSPTTGVISDAPSNPQTFSQETPIEMSFFGIDLRPPTQTRYSMDDFSDYLNNEPYDCPVHPVMSASLEQGPFDWDDYNIATPFTFNGIVDQVAPPTASSTVSHDQPCFSRSSSGTLSDAGEISILPDIPILTQTQQIPLDFDSAWTGSNPFADGSDFAALRSQSPCQDYKTPTYPCSLPSGMSPSMGYVAEEFKWLPLTSEPFPQRTTEGGFYNDDDNNNMFIPPFSENDAPVEAWPATLAYDFSAYGGVAPLGNAPSGNMEGMNWV